MSFSQTFFSPELIYAIGWTLFHSIWIGGAIYAVLIILFSFLNNISSQQRYFISFYSLLLLFILSFLCFLSIYNENPSSAMATYTGESILKIDSQQELMEIPSETGISVVLKNIKLFLTKNIPITVFIWAVGVMLMLIYYSGVFIYTLRLKSRNLYHVDPAFEKLIFHLSRKINLDKKVKIFESAMAKIPMAVGYFKPVILFPLGFLSGLSPDQVEVIILHELVHISRADFPSKILQSIVEIFLFMNPFTWLISSKINEERENSCDDIVLGNCTDAMIYAKALLKAGGYGFSHLQLAPALTGNKNLLLRRIKRMFNKSTEAKPLRSLTSFSLIVLFSMIFYITSQSDQAKRNSINESAIPVIQEANFSGVTLINPMPLIKDLPILDTSSETSEKILSFNAEFEGENSEWKVIFKSGKISELYRDGKKIPKSEVTKYEGLVYEEIAEIKSGNFPFLFDKYAFPQK